LIQKNLKGSARYAVIFTSQRAPNDPKGYSETAARMIELVGRQPGCLGFDSARDGAGFGITVSYWDSLEAIKTWRAQPEHQQAQAGGQNSWYAHYDVHISKIERSYSFPKP